MTATLYTPTHTRAFALVRRKGAAVTFTKTAPGTYDATTDTAGSDVTTTVTGYAVRAEGDPKTYEALKLIASEAPTVFFVPTTEGELPDLHMTVVFGGVTYSVRDVNPIAPAGVAIAAHVVVAT